MQTYTHYKESGIDWIGQIPEHWSISKLKYSGNSIIGLTYSPNHLCNEDEGTLVCRSSNIKDGKLTFNDNVFVKSKISEKLKLLKNDILICSRNGSRELIGKCALVEKQYPNLSFGAFTTVYRTMFYRFIYYYFNSPIFKSYSGSFLTSTINQLTTGNLNSFILTLPPIQEQEAIANFLDDKTAKIDALVQTKEQQIEKLKELRQAKIHQAVTKGLDANSSTKDSGVECIGEIPAHWEVKPLRYLGSTQNGLSKGGESFGKGTPFVSYSDVYKNVSLPINVSGLVEVSKDEINQYSVKEGDVFFTRTSETVEDIGFSSVALEAIEDATFAGFLIRFRPLKFKLLSKYSMYYFRSITHRPYLVGNMNLVIRASLSQELLKNLIVFLPPIQEQEQIVAYLDEVTGKIDQAIAQKKEQITKLKEYKQSLINDVVTGKVKVC